jgi:cyanate permease
VAETAGVLATGRETYRLGSDRALRATAIVFAVAVGVHGVDHLRRGLDVVTGVVFGAGATQGALAAVAITLVFRRHRFAPSAAAVVGLVSAFGFATSHLLPHWSAFRDSFTGSEVAPHVTAFSWFSALFEISADLAFGIVGFQRLRS